MKAECRQQLQFAEAARDEEKKKASDENAALFAEKGLLVGQLNAAKAALLSENSRFNAAQLENEEKVKRADVDLDGPKREVDRLVLLDRELAKTMKDLVAVNEKLKEKLV